MSVYIFISYQDHTNSPNLQLSLPAASNIVYDSAQIAQIRTIESHLFKPPDTPDSAHQLISRIWFLDH